MCKDNSECVKPAVCRNGACQTVAVEAEEMMKPDLLVREDHQAVSRASQGQLISCESMSPAPHAL